MGAGSIRPLRIARKLLERFGGSGLRKPPPGDRGYLICSSPRCGSTYFCELLASTGVLGVPREYLNVGGRWGRLDRDRPTDLHALLDRALRAGATPNGIYGLKVHADHFRAIAAVVDPLRMLPNLKLVRIRRQDVLAQAISWARAQATHQFRATDHQKHAPTYDAAAIRRLLGELIEQNAAWERLFAAVGRVPLEVEYERLLGTPQREVNRVAHLMGLSVPVPIAPQHVKVAIQRDELNAGWRSRFLAETGDEFRHLANAARPRSIPGSASAS
jgi:LPS sulfotransferase NodH